VEKCNLTFLVFNFHNSNS